MTEPDTAVWMRRLAALSRSEDALPDPVLIWWQARLLEREEARARAVRPLVVAQWASAVAAVAVVMALCVFYRPAIAEVLAPMATYTPWAAIFSSVALAVLAYRLIFSE